MQKAVENCKVWRGGLETKPQMTQRAEDVFTRGGFIHRFYFGVWGGGGVVFTFGK